VLFGTISNINKDMSGDIFMSKVPGVFKLLIVDDEVESLDSLSRLIESLGKKQGYKVITAGTVEQAIELFPEADAILADVNLPGKDQLNEILSHSEIPVARFSGDDQQVANFMLQKPFTRAELNKCLVWLKQIVANNEEIEGFLTNIKAG
jgi:CheY-like chemotaxis protein